MPFKIEFDGFSEFIQRLHGFENDLPDKVDFELSVAMENIKDNAKILAPVGSTGALADSITVTKDEKFEKEISVLAPYGAYVEFGTGVNVFKTPIIFRPEIREYAKEFYVSGLGLQRPNPYFFISMDLEWPMLIERIKKNVFDFD